jgi:hypothetical protein
MDEKTFMGINIEEILKRLLPLPPLHPRLLAGLRALMAGVVPATLFYNLFFIYVQPDEYGIKVVRVGLNRGVLEEYMRKLEEARGDVNKMVADADGQYLKDKIEADVYQEQQQLLAEAIRTEGIADAKGTQEMNNALAGAGGEAIVKLRIAEAMQGKHIMLLPVSEGGMNLKTTDMNRLIETLGIRSLSRAALTAVSLRPIGIQPFQTSRQGKENES